MTEFTYQKDSDLKNNNNAVVKEQLSLFVQPQIEYKTKYGYEKLKELLQSDLDFHNRKSGYGSHNFHSFPAKFPPQLPNLFIQELTLPGEIVLDPMVGSGTTMVETCFTGRRGIGFDIDPLALRIARVKTTPLSKKIILDYGNKIYQTAKTEIYDNKESIAVYLDRYFDLKTKEFVDYWFLRETQLELIALRRQIDKIQENEIKTFFDVVFSSIIITKSGGVSLALDLGHTRPHKVKALLDSQGNIIQSIADTDFDLTKKKYFSKHIKSALEEFRKKVNQNINSLIHLNKTHYKPYILYSDSQRMSLSNNTVDLIVTSPPYASNAIDYMRAHKFTLVWFGNRIEELTSKRNEYIGSESTNNYSFEDLPSFTYNKIQQLSEIDANRGRVLKRYFSEMKKTLTEMYRILKPGKSAIVVVGSSIMKGMDTETQKCLKEIGEAIGFQEPVIGERKLDRNKRMLPASKKTDLSSQIQQRMHVEYVIGFYKPL